MDLKLTNFDIDMTDGDLSFVENIDAVRQDIEMALRTWLEETPYDKSAGVPYIQIIFVRGTTPEAINFILKEQVLNRPNVTEVLEMDSVVDTVLRTIQITGKVRAFNAIIEFSVTPAASPGPFVPSTLAMRSWFDLTRGRFSNDSFGYVTISDEGSIGGTFAQATDAEKPAVTTSLGTLLRTNATPDGVDDNMVHTIAAASWKFLSDGSEATIAVVTTDPADADGTLFATMDGATDTTDLGIRLRRVGGDIELRISRRFAGFALDLTATVAADEAKIIVIRLDAVGVETQINGAVVAGLTAAYANTPATFEPDAPMSLFTINDGAAPPAGGGLWGIGWWYAAERRISDAEALEFATELNARYGIF